MSDMEDARTEAFKRYDWDRIIDETTGEEVSHDDWGYADTARQGFLDGVEWALASRESTADTEWEWSGESIQFPGTSIMRVYAVRADAERDMLPGHRLTRRRKAGPWEPVDAVQEPVPCPVCGRAEGHKMGCHPNTRAAAAMHAAPQERQVRYDNGEWSREGVKALTGASDAELDELGGFAGDTAPQEPTDKDVRKALVREVSLAHESAWSDALECAEAPDRIADAVLSWLHASGWRKTPKEGE